MSLVGLELPSTSSNTHLEDTREPKHLHACRRRLLDQLNHGSKADIHEQQVENLDMRAYLQRFWHFQGHRSWPFYTEGVVG